MVENEIFDEYKTLFGGWYLDNAYQVPFTEATINKNLTLYSYILEEELTPEERELNAIGLPEIIEGLYELPKKGEVFNYLWESNIPGLINEEGVVENKTASDLEVTFIAKIVTSQTFEKQFNVQVKGYPFAEVFAAIESYVTVPSFVEHNFAMPTVFSDGVVGSWHSSRPEVIDAEGRVFLTKKQEHVTLTLTLSKYDEIKEIIFEVVTNNLPYDVNDYEYFLSSIVKLGINPLQTLMTKEEINAFNETVYATSLAKVVKLENIAQTQTKQNVVDLINQYYNINNFSVYSPNHILATSEEKQAILDNRHLNNIPDVVNIAYAVSTTHVDLRSYPTRFYSSNEYVDQFQETGFSVGIPMVVYHTSFDNEWLFVQMYHYLGWVKASNVAKCSRSEFLTYLNPPSFIVASDSDVMINDEYVRMGYRLPYRAKTAEAYNVMFPTRNQSGNLVIEEVEVDINDKISDGYLTFTYDALLATAFKMLNVPYSWGDKLVQGYDCSSTQAAIYNCFGFILGRNTSNQRRTNVYGKTLSTLLTNDLIQTYPVGTLFYTSGHVLMYIGVDEEGQGWFLHNTTSTNHCVVQEFQYYTTDNIKYYLQFLD